jgi:hypothetical protein
MPRFLLHIAISMTLLLTQGCMDLTIQEYETLTIGLDEKNELEISTYPAGYPEKEFHIPFLYKASRTPDEVYFQVFIKDRERYGPNHHIDSIHIESFSYHFPADEPTVLFSNYEDNFWMQGSPQYESEHLPPIPWNEHWYLQVRISMKVNGVAYTVDERLHATTRKSITPLLLYFL